ncbi:hypothetical protein M3Y97_00304100 [Aphelenchoides bicaudatus]|nr:hypothetical protein M3Y97_00304100 [Aphelenchoides bicaudatus]
MDPPIAVEQMDRESNLKSNSTKKRGPSNGKGSPSKLAPLHNISKSSQDCEDSQDSSTDSPIIFVEKRSGNGVNGALPIKRRKCAVPAKNSKKVAETKAQEKKEKPAKRSVTKNEAPKRKYESKAIKPARKNGRKSVDEDVIEVGQIHKNKDALPVSKRLRERSQPPTETADDNEQRPPISDPEDHQIKSPPKKRQRQSKQPKQSNGVKKAATKPVKRAKRVEKEEEPENEVQDQLLPEPAALTDDELIDVLDNSDDEGMDQESIVKKLREQKRKIKWDNLKLREQKIDLIEEVERLKAEQKSHQKVCRNQKQEFFDLRIENHELRRQNSDLMEKNRTLERDNIAKTRSHEIVKNELTKCRTEVQLKKQTPQIKQTSIESYVAPASQKANKSAGTLRNGSEPKKRGRVPKASKTQDANLEINAVDEF